MSKSIIEKEKVPSVPGLGDGNDGESAVGAVRDEAVAVPIERAGRPNYDVTAGVFMVGTVLPRVMHFRDEIRKRAPDVDIKKLDRIKQYALAAWHVTTVGRIEPKKVDPAPMARAQELIGDFELAEAFLVRKGVLDAARVQKLKPGPGQSQQKAWVVDTLEKHVALWRESADASRKYALISDAEIAEAAQLGAKIMLPAESPDADRDAENLFRYQVVALFTEAWEEIRRGIRHIRWYEGDWDSIAPSLRLQAAGRRGPADSEEPAATAPAVPVAKSPDVAPGTPGAPKEALPPSDGKVLPGDDSPFKK